MPADTNSKKSYLREHIAYEILMLRYDIQRLEDAKHQLEWNAFFESFCIHARSLYSFFRNDGKQGAIKAKDYGLGKFHHQNKDKLFEKINHQIAHLTNQRTRDIGAKLSLQDCKEIRAWVEDALFNFLENLPPEYANEWNEADATPPQKSDQSKISLRDATPSASGIFTTSTDYITGDTINLYKIK